MDTLFERFIRQEYEFLYDCEDSVEMLVGDLENEISTMKLMENLEDFIERATENFCNDEYIIQMMHDWMHDELINVIDSSLDD
jgi:hypothetical protein